VCCNIRQEFRELHRRRCEYVIEILTCLLVSSVIGVISTAATRSNSGVEGTAAIAQLFAEEVRLLFRSVKGEEAEGVGDEIGDCEEENGACQW
jgi:hypothetical protein